MPLPEPAPVDVPKPVLEMISKLKTEGFRVGKELYSRHSFGNWQFILEHGPLSVEILRDRGLWSIRAGGVGLGRSMVPLDTWRECLEDRKLPVAELELADYCAILVELWPSMEEALAPQRVTDTRNCLSIRGHERYRRSRENQRSAVADAYEE